MRNIRQILCLLLGAGCCGLLPSGCVKEQTPSAASGRNVTVRLNVDSRVVDDTNGTPAAEESEIHSLRVYAFVGGRPAGHYFQQGAPTVESRFLMDLAMYSETTQTVDFYVVANEEAMSRGEVSAGLSENTSEAALKRLSFIGLKQGFGLPMFYAGRQSIDMSQDADTNPQEVPGHEGHTLLKKELRFELARPVAKLGLFAAKEAGEPGTLVVTGLTLPEAGLRMRNYLMPQTSAVLQGVPPSNTGDVDLPVVSDPVESELRDDITPEERRNPANYTPVLETPYYPFENPWGYGGSWDTPGDEHGMVLAVRYAFDGGEPRTGYVYMPPIERNTYYAVCCRMTNSGKIAVEYVVAPWDDEEAWDNVEFEYPSYENPVLPVEGGTPDRRPVVYYNPDADSEEGAFSVQFKITGPQEQEWRATLLDASEADFEVKVFQGGAEVERPVASADPYTIRVRALNPGNEGKTVSLGVAYTPTWDPTGSSLLLINGHSNDIAWPESGADPERIVITQVAAPNN